MFKTIFSFMRSVITSKYSGVLTPTTAVGPQYTAVMVTASTPIDIVSSPDSKNIYIPGSAVLNQYIKYYNGIVAPLVPASISITTAGGNGVCASSDGLFVYANGGATMNMFSRDTTTGVLSVLTTALVTTNTGGNCCISPDGLFVYAGNNSTGTTVYMFSRDTSTGILTAGTSSTVTGGAGSSYMSPDGLNVYSLGTNIIYVNSRNTSTGILSPTSTNAITGNTSLTISPDGLNVYAVGTSTTYVFNRNTSTGALSAGTPSSVTSGSGNTPYMCSISHDNKNAYITNRTGNYIAQYSRATSTGVLTDLGVNMSINLSTTDPRHIYSTPDGKIVQVYCYTPSRLVYFNRDTSTGLLSQIQTESYIPISASPASPVITADGLFAYVTSSGLVYQFSRDISTGNLTPLTTATAGTSAASIVITADGLFAYVGNYGALTISQYSRSTSTGLLTPLSSPTIATSQGGSAITMSADQKFIYAACYGIASQPGVGTGTTVNIYSRDTSTGLLTNTGASGTTGAGSQDPKISPDGLFLYTANYGAAGAGTTISMMSRNTSTGALGAKTDVSAGAGTGPAGIAFSADGAFAYVGNRLSNTIGIYTRNTSTGALTLSSTIASGILGTTGLMGPTIVDDEYLYFAHISSHTAAIFSRDTSTGALTALGNFETFGGTSGWNTSPDGKYFYITGTTTFGLIKYSRDTSTGLIGLIPNAPQNSLATGTSPKGMAISPLGDSIYVCNSTLLNLSQFSRNTTTGVLATVGTFGTGSVPNGVTVSPDGKNVYIASSGVGVATYNRNTSTGVLTGGATILGPLPYKIVISSDGLNVYTTSGTTSGVVYQYTRNTSTGALTQLSNTPVTQGSPYGISISPDAKTVYVCNSAAGNISHYSRDTSTGNITLIAGPIQTVTGSLPRGMAISPDGANLYCTSFGANFYQYARNTISGELSYFASGTNTSLPINFKISADGLFGYIVNSGSVFISLYSRSTSTGLLNFVSSVSGGTSPYDMIIASNAIHVYDTDTTGNLIYFFTRNTSTGVLTASSSQATGTSPKGICMSADGLHVYSANYGGNNITRVIRNTSTGAISSPVNYAISGVAPTGMCISPDGLHVYAASYPVSYLARNTSTGALSGGGTIAGGAQPYDIKITSNGLFVYVSSVSDNTIWQYSRNTSTGVLTSLTPASLLIAATSPGNILLSPDEKLLYVSNYWSNTISTYNRDTSTGLLTAQTKVANLITMAASATPKGIIVSPDGLHVYVCNSALSNLSGFSRNTTTGLLTNLSVSTYSTGSTPTEVAISPSGLHVYVINYNATGVINQLSRDTTTGLLTAGTTYTSLVGASPGQGKVSADGNSFYVAGYAAAAGTVVYQFTRNTSTGAIAAMGAPSVTASTAPYAIAITPDNTGVYVTTTSGGVGGIQQYTRNTSTGALTSVGFFSTGGTASNIFGIVSSPDSNYIYSTGNGVIYQQSRNTSTGALSALSPASVATGAGVNYLSISADGNFLYATDDEKYSNYTYVHSVNLLTGALGAGVAFANSGQNPYANVVSPDGNFLYTVNKSSNTVTTMSRNTSTGAVSLVMQDFALAISAGQTPYEMVISSDGKFAYATENTNSRIYQYSRDTTTGVLASLSIQYVNTGSTPYGLKISPDGTSLYVACSAIGGVYEYSRDTITGLLSALTPVFVSSVVTAGTTYTPIDIVVSPDSTMVYVDNSGANNILQFTRN